MANLGYIQLVRTCNQNCRFCSNPEMDSELSLDQAREQIDDFVERGYHGIILTGGEPTLYPALNQVLDHAARRGISVRMITNGQLTASREFLDGLVAAGLEQVHLSVHTCQRELQAFLTGCDDSLDNIEKSLDNFGAVGMNVVVNITIQAYNCKHLDGIVKWLIERWSFLSHFVFNNLDPTSNRCLEYPDTIPKLRDLEIPLLKALTILDRTGRTFRVERLPLCYMVEFAHASTETRKIVKEEERIVYFLDDKGMVRQTSWDHGKAEACRVCSLDAICAGLYEMDRHYDSGELSPVFVSPEPIIRRIREDDE